MMVQTLSIVTTKGKTYKEQKWKTKKTFMIVFLVVTLWNIHMWVMTLVVSLCMPYKGFLFF